jgi:hypothetical protein
MRSARRRFLLLQACFALVAGTAQAQESPSVSQLIEDTVIASQVRLITGIGNAASFDFGVPVTSFEAAGALTSALVYQTGAFPIGSSSGGFTYFFDATTGAFVRSSPSFGPIFAERPVTSGRGTLNLGITFMHRSFSRLEGKRLDDGSLKFYSPLESSVSGALIDLIESTVRLDIVSDTGTFFATYGVMNKLDVSLALPIQHVSVDADVTSQLVRYGPGSSSNIAAAQVSRRKSAQGLGDVAVRAKYNVVDAPWGAVAGGIDLRLPSGDEDDLLGTGRIRTQIYAAVTSKMPRFYPHANFGYTFKAKEDPDEIYFFGPELSYAVGAEFILNPRLTVIGDIVGRSLADEGRLLDQSSTFQLVATAGGNPPQSRTVAQLTLERGRRLNSTLGVIGAKFNPVSTFIISAHVLLTATKAGIRSRPAPMIGFDYSF